MGSVDTPNLISNKEQHSMKKRLRHRNRQEGGRIVAAPTRDMRTGTAPVTTSILLRGNMSGLRLGRTHMHDPSLLLPTGDRDLHLREEREHGWLHESIICIYCLASVLITSSKSCMYCFLLHTLPSRNCLCTFCLCMGLAAISNMSFSITR